MRALLRCAARLYPAVWRRRYGAEFEALVEDLEPSFGNLMNLLSGAVDMHLTRRRLVWAMAACALVGAVVAGGYAAFVPGRYSSSGTISIRAADAAASSPQASLRTAPTLLAAAFPAERLQAVATKHQLFGAGRESSGSAVERMRRDIRVQVLSPTIFELSFLSDRQEGIQLVADDLLKQVIDQVVEARSSEPSIIASILDHAAPPVPATSRRRVTQSAIAGLVAGALLGGAGGLLGRRRRVVTS